MLEANIIESRGLQLLSILERPETQKDNKTLVFFCHGFVGHKITPHRMIPKIHHQLVERGYTVCRTDCVGSGDSQGDYSYMTIPGQVEDYLAVINSLKSQVKWEKLILLGYSMGGTTSTLLSHHVKPDELILWSPVSNPLWNFHHILGSDLFQAGMSGQDISIDADEVSPNFFENIDELLPLEIIKQADFPIRIIHGTCDEDVLPINGWLYNFYAKDGKVHFVEGAGHTYEKIEYQKELFDYTMKFIQEI